MQKKSYYDVVSHSDWAYTKHDRNEALKRIRELLNEDGPVQQSGHFKKRAVEREFTFQDAYNVLERGQILREPEPEDGTWRYRIETKKMAVIVAFSEDGKVIRLVTAMWKAEGRSL